MTNTDYRAALDAAIREHETLDRQRREIDDRLAQLGQTIGTLTRLLGLVPTVPLGLTDACRMVLRHGQPMTPIEVRDRLLAVGIDVSKYANDLAAVHTILKRLSSSGELRFIQREPGKHQYAWNRPATPEAGSCPATARGGARCSTTFRSRGGVRCSAAGPLRAGPRG